MTTRLNRNYQRLFTHALFSRYCRWSALFCVLLLQNGVGSAQVETEIIALEGAQALAPSTTAHLTGELDLWRARAQAWYQSDDLKSRRSQMREMSRPLKQACYYCHTGGFKGYEDATYLISLQMMAITAEQGVKCVDCHLGRRGLTELGAKSLIQWRYAVKQDLDCRECHLSGGRFKRLTTKGEASRESLLPWVAQLGEEYHVSREVIKRLTRQLSSASSTDQVPSLSSPLQPSPPLPQPVLVKPESASGSDQHPAGVTSGRANTLGEESP